jgi:hypothetical protein
MKMRPQCVHTLTNIINTFYSYGHETIKKIP